MSPDEDLLKAYADQGSESAFTEVVQRHVQRVYSVALRQVAGDHALAEDIAQKVFADLARKSAGVARQPSVGAWLHRATVYAAANEVRELRRRRERERTWEETRVSDEGGLNWRRDGIALDQLVAGMDERERTALWLRFSAERSYAAIGSALGLSENAARMCTDRALEKLRIRLSKRGITSTAAAIAGALASEPLVSAPGGIAAKALSAAAAGSAGHAVARVLIMKTANIAATAVLVLSAGAYLHYRGRAETARTEIAAIRSARMTANAAPQPLQIAPPIGGTVSGLRTVPAAPQAGSPTPATTLNSRPPQALTQTVPEYPAELKAANISGKVRIEYIVDSSGRIATAWPTDSTVKALEQPTVAAAQTWTFSPGLVRGKQVSTLSRSTVFFNAANGTVKIGELETAPIKSPEWF